MKILPVAAVVIALTACSAQTSGQPLALPSSASPSATVTPTILHFTEDPSFEDDRVVRIRGEEPGEVVAHLTVRKLDLIDYPIRFGISLDVLDEGPGLYPGSAAPGEGNFSMAGHRITPVGPFRTCSTGEWGTADCHGPFRYVDTLHKGDVATVIYRGKTYRYVFVRNIIVRPTNVSILRDGRADMTFTACHPPGLSTKRIVTQWRLS